MARRPFSMPVRAREERNGPPQCLKYGGITVHMGSDKPNVGSDKTHVGQ